MSVVVTGVAGFIGSRLAERLLEEGEAVIGIDRLSPAYDPALKRLNLERLAGERFRFVEADLSNTDLEPLLDGADVVYHLAAQPGVRVSWGGDFGIYVRDNVLATQRLLEAARATGPGRVVAASSSSVYGNAEHHPVAESARRRPISPYGVTKLAAEELCRLYATQFSVPTVGLRYFTIFGPRQRPDMAFSRFIAAAREGRPIEVYGDGLQVRDFTYVDDAVAATIAAASAGGTGSTYNVAGGCRATVLEVIERLEALLGREVGVTHLPAAAGDVRETSADIGAAREELGYRPRTSLEEGLARQIEAQAGASAIQSRG